jgi:tetratricopeptide (TPR) repeat protein
MRALRSALAAPLLLSLGCLTTPPPNDRALFNNELCAQQIQAGDLKQAEIYCDLGLEFAPQYADLWVNKGIIAMGTGRKEDAKAHFIKAIRFNQDQASAYLNLGKLYLDEGANGKAHDSFQRALKVNPDYIEARYNLALTFINLEKLGQAEKELRTILAINPNIAEIHHGMGVVHYRGGRLEEALAELGRAVELAPNLSADWWNDLGAVQMELSRFAEAKQSFGSCVALDGKHPLCLDNLSIAQRKAALTDSALKELRDTRRAENSPEALFLLARQYMEQGLLSEEERTYKQCLKLDGKYAPCHYGLFQLYLEAHKREHAEVACKNFLKYGSVEDFPTEMQSCENFLSARSQ